MFDGWNHLPHWLRSIIVGNIIQIIFVAALRPLAKRYGWLQPILNRLGPKSLRDKRTLSKGQGFLIGLCWFALSWYIGHWALRIRGQVAGWVLQK